MDAIRRTTVFVALALVVAGALPGMVSTSRAEEGEESSEEKGVDAAAQLRQANRLAGRQAFAMAIPHYEKAIKAGADASAHYNLAEVLKAQEEFERALIHYQAYILLGNNEGTKAKARRGIEQLKARVWNKKLASLSVDIEPEKRATVRIDGLPVARNRDLEDFELVAGEYEVSADIVDHEPISKTVELDYQDEQSIELQPVKKTFFGTIRVTVDEDDASVKLKPEKLDAPRKPNEGASTTSPVEKPIELETGKWLLEVTKKGFHRWVRYVHIKRGKTATVQVDMQKKLPEEIR